MCIKQSKKILLKRPFSFAIGKLYLRYMQGAKRCTYRKYNLPIAKEKKIMKHPTEYDIFYWGIATAVDLCLSAKASRYCINKQLYKRDCILEGIPLSPFHQFFDKVYISSSKYSILLLQVI